jgi:hypothetical protein
MTDKEKKRVKVAMEVELVGIKNLKSTRTWRLEFDVYEVDNNKVKELFDLIDQPLTLGIVGPDVET